jgi:hypothetical protein
MDQRENEKIRGNTYQGDIIRLPAKTRRGYTDRWTDTEDT